MPKLIKHRFKLYKRFELDIWGLLNNNPIFGHPVVKFFQDSYRYRAERAKQRFKKFIYRIDIINPDKTHKRKKWKFVSMQLVRLFYRGVNQKKVFYFSALASSKMGFWVDNFLLALESRVSTFVYRINWVQNILFLKQFLNHGNVLVEGKIIRSVNFTLKPSQLVQVNKSFCRLVWLDILYRARLNLLYFNSPRYSFVNYKIMFATIFRNPKLNDLSFPVLLDIYRLNDLN